MGPKFLLSVCVVLSVLSPGFSAFNSYDCNFHPNHARTARCLVHRMDWMTGTMYPSLNVISMADSPIGENSTGHIYFMLPSPKAQAEAPAIKLTVILTASQKVDCSFIASDPMEHTCARVIITGTAVAPLDPAFGNQSMYSRHPRVNVWVQAHNFKLYELDITDIVVIDGNEPYQHVNREEYFAVTDEDPSIV